MRKATIIIFLILIVNGLYAKDPARITPYMNFQYFRNNGDSSYLKAVLSFVSNRMERPIPGQKISFFNGEGEKLGDVVTDPRGIAMCYVLRENLKTGSEGMWMFTASFDGNDTIGASSSELSIRNASLDMECSEADSIKTVTVHAEKIENGEMVAAAGEILTVYVKRMFSLLPVGEVTLDDSGSGSVQFPDDLPGDINGFVTLVARFEDHPEFGNIERKELKRWGIPFVETDHTSRRALWTKTAPRWMIYTLTILLTGVWGHYLFTLISLVRIKLSASANKEKEMDTKDIFLK